MDAGQPFEFNLAKVTSLDGLNAQLNAIDVFEEGMPLAIDGSMPWGRRTPAAVDKRKEAMGCV